MSTALLAAVTRAMPDGTEGYEGTAAAGFRAAGNRILWTGDAGLGASLDDMIAWERHIDRTATTRHPSTDAFPPPHRSQAVPRPPTASAWPAAPNTAVPSPATAALSAAGAATASMWPASASRSWSCSTICRTPPLPPWTSSPPPSTTRRQPSSPPPRHRPGSAPIPTPPRPCPPASRQQGMAGCACATATRRNCWSCKPTAPQARTATASVPLPKAFGIDRPGENTSTRLLPVPPGTPAPDITGATAAAELDAALTVEDAGGVPYGAFSGMLGLAAWRCSLP